MLLSDAVKGHLCKLKVSGNNHMILRAIEFLSDESGMDECNLSNIQISNVTGIACNHVGAQLALLAKLRIIDLGKGHCRTIRLNPNLGEWQLKKGGAMATAKAMPKPKAQAAVTPKPRKVAKPKSGRAKNSTPEWFKELWGIYPAHRRGGNFACAWKKWQSIGLAEQDTKEAMKWLAAAAKADPDWTQDAVSGFAVGITKFIDQTHWRTPVPTRQATNGRTKRVTDFDSGTPVDYSTGVKEFNEEAAAWAEENEREDMKYAERNALN